MKDKDFIVGVINKSKLGENCSSLWFRWQWINDLATELLKHVITKDEHEKEIEELDKIIIELQLEMSGAKDSNYIKKSEVQPLLDVYKRWNHVGWITGNFKDEMWQAIKQLAEGGGE